jgi:CRISPR-associated endonuclease Csn1
MARILGLDLGTNSIGWAIIDDKNNEILDAGVRIFHEGVNRDTQGREVSKNETRRNARQIRRQLYRTKMRRYILLKELRNNQMAPLHNKELSDWFKLNPYELRAKSLGDKLSLFEIGRIFYHISQHRGFKSSRKAGKEDGTIYTGVPKEGKIGINETDEKIEQYKTLGSYLYTISHKENTPFEERERIRNRYTLRRMYEQEFDAIWDVQSDFYPKILTSNLRYKIGYKPETKNSSKKEGIIFFQRPLRSQKKLLGKCTFENYQFWDKEKKNKNKWRTIGKTRCPISHPKFELYRTYSFLNTIEFGNRQKLSVKQKELLIEKLFNNKDKFAFKEIKKTLKLENEAFNYDISDEEKQKILGNYTISNLKKLFTPQVWNKKNDKEVEIIWHIIYDANDKKWLNNYARKNWNFDDNQIKKLENIHFKQDYSNLSLKAIDNILFFLQKEEGYLYSNAVMLGGIRNAFGRDDDGIYKFDKFNESEQNFIINRLKEINQFNNKEGEAIDMLKNFLIDTYNLSDKELKRLYHHSQATETSEIRDELATPENFRNPIVQQAMHEIKRVVNTLLEKYGKFDEIKVELARELKMSKSQRDEMRFKNMEREDRNDEAKQKLSEYGLAHSRNNIHKYLLWKELQDYGGTATCPYTGKTINISDLFNDNKFQIEHIIPRSISLDDSFANKTICDAQENQLKGNKTPYQFYKSSPEKWEVIKERAKKIIAPNNYGKYKRFISEIEKYELDDFVSKQLNDTRYISRQAKEYLKTICKKVNVSAGGVTSELRHYWGLNSILGYTIKTDCPVDGHYWAVVDKNNELIELEAWTYKERKSAPKRLEKKGELLYGFVNNGQFIPQKQRDDHRHHAVDAITIACIKDIYVKNLAKWNRLYRSYENNNFPLPWDSFRKDVENIINNTLISFSVKRKITTKIVKHIYKGGKKILSEGIAARGQLHKETVYGQYVDENGKQVYHIRKPLIQITKKAQVDKIVDKKIKRLVIERLRELNVDITKKYDIPPGAFFQSDEKTKKLIPLLFLDNSKGKPVPIKKVRLKENIGNAVQLKDAKIFAEKKQSQIELNQFVNPQNNHHVAIYEDENGALFEGIKDSNGDPTGPVTFWDAVERKKQGLPVIEINPKDGSKFITSLQINDLFLLRINEDDINWQNKELISKYLYRVQKLSSVYYNFRHHLASTLNNPNDERVIQSFKAWKELNPIKVKIDILGNISKY